MSLTDDRRPETPVTTSATIEPGATRAPHQVVLARRYRLGEVLAEGGMGIVHRAWHVVLERPVAVKVLRPELAVHEEIVERFSREARASAALRSPHVVTVLDVGKDAHGVPFLVMELLEGADLGSILNEQRALQVQQAIRFICQACLGLRDAHAAGIVHRDLKPENLYLSANGESPEGTIKILDFGISKRVGERVLTRTGQNLGSPQYMAPEQVLSPSSVDGRADIWSLGVVLFELVTGRPVFEGLTIPAVYSAALYDDPPLLRSCCSGAPATLERVVSKCLQKRPENRYANVDELRQALELVAHLEQPAGFTPECCASEAGKSAQKATDRPTVLEEPSEAFPLTRKPHSPTRRALLAIASCASGAWPR